MQDCLNHVVLDEEEKIMTDPGLQENSSDFNYFKLNDDFSNNLDLFNPLPSSVQEHQSDPVVKLSGQDHIRSTTTHQLDHTVNLDHQLDLVVNFSGQDYIRSIIPQSYPKWTDPFLDSFSTLSRPLLPFVMQELSDYKMKCPPDPFHVGIFKAVKQRPCSPKKLSAWRHFDRIT